MQTATPSGLVASIRAAGGLDAAYRTGALVRRVNRQSPPEGPPLPTGEAAPGGWRRIPLINLASAGRLEEFTDLGYPARVADRYILAQCDDPDAFAVKLVGDSMAPLYREGDVVVLSPMLTVVSGMDCFVRVERDDQSTFKRVRLSEDDEGRGLIHLEPLNGQYEGSVYPREDVAMVAPAVSFTRRVLGFGI